MPSRADIITFHDPPVPEGRSPWVPGAAPSRDLEVVDPDPAWPDRYDALAGRVCEALGWRALSVEHVGSTSVPGLAAKPVIDIDLTVADPDDESAYVPALEVAGFELKVREPWWFGYRALRSNQPREPVEIGGLDHGVVYPDLIRALPSRDVAPPRLLRHGRKYGGPAYRTTDDRAFGTVDPSRKRNVLRSPIGTR